MKEKLINLAKEFEFYLAYDSKQDYFIWLTNLRIWLGSNSETYIFTVEKNDKVSWYVRGFIEMKSEKQFDTLEDTLEDALLTCLETAKYIKEDN